MHYGGLCPPGGLAPPRTEGKRGFSQQRCRIDLFFGGCFIVFTLFCPNLQSRVSGAWPMTLIFPPNPPKTVIWQGEGWGERHLVKGPSGIELALTDRW